MKRAHANELARVQTWEGLEQKSKRRKMRRVTLEDSGDEGSRDESNISNRIRASTVLEGSDQARDVMTPENQGVRVRTDDKPLLPNTREGTSGNELDRRMKYPSPSFASGCENRKESQRQKTYLLNHG